MAGAAVRRPRVSLEGPDLAGLRAALQREAGGISYLMPAALLFSVFVILPVLQAGYYSFFRWNGYGTPTNWVGWRNYLTLFENVVFHTAMWNTAAVVAVSLLVQLPLAMAMALLLADRFPGSYTFRTIFFLPYVLSEVVAGLIWRFVFDGNFGLVAAATRWFGLEPAYPLAEPQTALMIILVVIIWKYFGFHMMIYLAALQDIPKELREAAAIDGATRAQVTRFVVLPLLWPAVRISVFFSVLGALQLFDVIMPLTGGGPSNTTHTLVTFQYTFGMTRMNIGFGCAVGVVLFCICMLFTLVYRRLLLREAQP
jgi:raffinose/stachyose/melibiose transport system permease protein